MKQAKKMLGRLVKLGLLAGVLLSLSGTNMVGAQEYPTNLTDEQKAMKKLIEAQQKYAESGAAAKDMSEAMTKACQGKKDNEKTTIVVTKGPTGVRPEPMRMPATCKMTPNGITTIPNHMMPGVKACEGKKVDDRVQVQIHPKVPAETWVCKGEPGGLLIAQPPEAI